MRSESGALRSRIRRGRIPQAASSAPGHCQCLRHVPSTRIRRSSRCRWRGENAALKPRSRRPSVVRRSLLRAETRRRGSQTHRVLRLSEPNRKTSSLRHFLSRRDRSFVASGHEDPTLHPRTFPGPARFRSGWRWFEAPFTNSRPSTCAEGARAIRCSRIIRASRLFARPGSPFTRPRVGSESGYCFVPPFEAKHRATAVGFCHDDRRLGTRSKATRIRDSRVSPCEKTFSRRLDSRETFA